MIADKDATVLRLQAQVREYAVSHEQAVAASVSQAQTAEIAVRDADESAGQAKDLAAKLALSLETRRTAEHKIMKLAADLKAADEALTRALEQAEAWRRQCEQDSALLKTTALEASTLRQERDTLHVTASENQTRIRELEAGAAELRSQMSQRQMQLDALRATLEAMKSTRAWRFADAIRRLSRPSST